MSQSIDNPQLPPVQGTHVLGELSGCSYDSLNDKDALVEMLVRAAEVAGATVLNQVSHSFSPHGVTVVLLLTESHASVHTWPEHGYAAIDIFTCGAQMNAERFVDTVIKALKPTQHDLTTVQRQSGTV